MYELDHSSQLTEREREILNFLIEGWSNKQIANELRITIRTVKFHTNNLYAKVKVASRAEAIAWAWKQYAFQSVSDS